MNNERFYRSWHSGRFQSFIVGYKETDLWIGVDKYYPEMPEATLNLIKKVRKQLDDYIDANPDFLLSFEPITDENATSVAKKMIRASKMADVGPMAAVAGAVADEIGAFLSYEFGCKELIVENGGDISVKVQEPITISVYAGDSPLSGRIGLSIPQGVCGVCTSSATVGPSISFGKADAVTVISKTAAVADAFATFYGNRVKQEEDMEKVLGETLPPQVDTLLIVMKDMMGIVGKHKLQIVESGDCHESC
ncbi:UPF0280 family protein [Coprothermobacter platensis]|uniref:UPF0280 family protein n=1 Tax=Coprothermobacter platensis TaxID=108819 RepID=UPI00036C831A|nr:UPF0280 family protein [Coprothermobacter platensis]